MTTLPIIVLAALTGVSEGQNIQGEGRKLASASIPPWNEGKDFIFETAIGVGVNSRNDCKDECTSEDFLGITYVKSERKCYCIKARFPGPIDDYIIDKDGSSYFLFGSNLDEHTTDLEKVYREIEDDPEYEAKQKKLFLETITSASIEDIEAAIQKDETALSKLKDGRSEVFKNSINNIPMTMANKELGGGKEFETKLLSGDIDEVRTVITKLLETKPSSNRRALSVLEDHSTQDIVDLITQVTDVADVFALAGSEAFGNLSSHITLVEPLMALPNKNNTAQGKLRSLLEFKLNVLALATADLGPVGTLINFAYQFSTTINNHEACENQENSSRGDCELPKLKEDLPIIVMTAVLETIGNGHLLDAFNIFQMVQNVAKKGSLTALDVDDVLLIGAAAMRGGCTAATIIFPIAVTPCNVAVKLVIIAAGSEFWGQGAEDALDNILGTFDETFDDNKVLERLSRHVKHFGRGAEKAFKILRAVTDRAIHLVVNLGGEVFGGAKANRSVAVVRSMGARVGGRSPKPRVVVVETFIGDGLEQAVTDVQTFQRKTIYRVRAFHKGLITEGQKILDGLHQGVHNILRR